MSKRLNFSNVWLYQIGNACKRLLFEGLVMPLDVYVHFLKRLKLISVKIKPFYAFAILPKTQGDNGNID